jgi:hypothetical protein
MKINPHLVGIARHSSRGILLTDRCSGAFLIHVVRAALLAVVLAVVVVLVAGRMSQQTAKKVSMPGPPDGRPRSRLKLGALNPL